MVMQLGTPVQVCVQVTNLTCTGVPSCITIDIKEVPAIPVFKQN
jgi:hypothetical protein